MGSTKLHLGYNNAYIYCTLQQNTRLQDRLPVLLQNTLESGYSKYAKWIEKTELLDVINSFDGSHKLLDPFLGILSPLEMMTLKFYAFPSI